MEGICVCTHLYGVYLFTSRTNIKDILILDRNLCMHARMSPTIAREYAIAKYLRLG